MGVGPRQILGYGGSSFFFKNMTLESLVHPTAEFLSSHVTHSIFRGLNSCLFTRGLLAITVPISVKVDSLHWQRSVEIKCECNLPLSCYYRS